MRAINNRHGRNDERKKPRWTTFVMHNIHLIRINCNSIFPISVYLINFFLDSVTFFQWFDSIFSTFLDYKHKLCFPFQYQDFYALNHRKNCVTFIYRTMIVLNISWLGRRVFFSCMKHPFITPRCFQKWIFISIYLFYLVLFCYFSIFITLLNVHSTYTIYRSYFFLVSESLRIILNWLHLK